MAFWGMMSSVQNILGRLIDASQLFVGKIDNGYKYVHSILF